MFKVGDKVLINRSSVYYGACETSNPADKVGEIVAIHMMDLGIRVMWDWDERISNTYNVSDLIYVNKEKRRVADSKLIFRFV